MSGTHDELAALMAERWSSGAPSGEHRRWSAADPPLAADVNALPDGPGFASDFWPWIRQVVIVGPAGSGRVALAGQMLRALLEHRTAGDPVPVMLSAGSWDARSESLRGLVTRCVERDHPEIADRGPVDAGRILPILIGLDELSDERRAAARSALSRTGGMPFIATWDERDPVPSLARVVRAATPPMPAEPASGRHLRFLAGHLTRAPTRELLWWNLHRAVPPAVTRFALVFSTAVAGAWLALLGALLEQELSVPWLVTGAAFGGVVGALRDPPLERRSARLERSMIWALAIMATVCSIIDLLFGAAGEVQQDTVATTVAGWTNLTVFNAVAVAAVIGPMNAWLTSVWSQVILALLRRTPLRSRRFLDLAAASGPLVRIGACYRFRDSRVRVALAGPLAIHVNDSDAAISPAARAGSPGSTDATMFPGSPVQAGDDADTVISASALAALAGRPAVPDNDSETAAPADSSAFTGTAVPPAASPARAGSPGSTGPTMFPGSPVQAGDDADTVISASALAALAGRPAVPDNDSETAAPADSSAFAGTAVPPAALPRLAGSSAPADEGSDAATPRAGSPGFVEARELGGSDSDAAASLAPDGGGAESAVTWRPPSWPLLWGVVAVAYVVAFGSEGTTRLVGAVVGALWLVHAATVLPGRTSVGPGGIQDRRSVRRLVPWVALDRMVLVRTLAGEHLEIETGGRRLVLAAPRAVWPFRKGIEAALPVLGAHLAAEAGIRIARRRVRVGRGTTAAIVTAGALIFTLSYHPWTRTGFPGNEEATAAPAGCDVDPPLVDQMLDGPPQSTTNLVESGCRFGRYAASLQLIYFVDANLGMAGQDFRQMSAGLQPISGLGDEAARSVTHNEFGSAEVKLVARRANVVVEIDFLDATPPGTPIGTPGDPTATSDVLAYGRAAVSAIRVG